MTALFRIAILLGLASGLGGCATAPVATSGRPKADGGLAAGDADRAAAMAHIVRARLADELDGAPLAAAEAYVRAARLMPDRPEPALQAALLHLREKRPGEAIEILRWALTRHPHSPELHYALAHVLRQTGDDLEAARHHYETARALDPDAPLPVIALTALALEDSQTEKALRTLTEAVERGIDDQRITALLYELAQLLLATGRFEDALECLRPLVAINPENPEPRRLLALTYIRLERFEDARAAIAEWPAAAARPDLAADLLASVYEAVEDHGRALEWSLAALAEPDEHTPLTAWMRAGRILLSQDPAAAVPLMEKATVRHPEIEMLWLFRGLAYASAERHREALEALQEAASLADAHPAEHRRLPPMFDFWIGAAYERNDLFDDAERHFRRSIQAHPGIHQAFNYLAYMWAENGTNLDEALELVDVALQAEPENAAYIDTLGWIYYRMGRHDKALTELKRALAIIPDDPVVNDHAGDALHALGREREALEHWKRSFKGDPDNAAVAAKLERAGVETETLRATP